MCVEIDDQIANLSTLVQPDRREAGAMILFCSWLVAVTSLLFQFGSCSAGAADRDRRSTSRSLLSDSGRDESHVKV